jgi:predicted dehydrogenase
VGLCEGAGPAGAYTKRFPQAKPARSEQEILEDASIHLVVSAAIPDERAPLGIRVMRHGKDFMADKPGMTTLEQLAEVRGRCRPRPERIYSIAYSERLENRATTHAGELVKAGAIGRVLQTVGLGPHRMNPKTRPAWFFERERYGGILCDIGSHQADQFLFFTGSTSAEVGGVAGRQPAPPAVPRPRGLRRRHGARQRRHGLLAHRLVHAGRPGHLGRRPAHDPRHRRVHRAAQEHRHRRAARRQPPVPGRSEGDPLHRLPRRRPSPTANSSSPTS